MTNTFRLEPQVDNKLSTISDLDLKRWYNNLINLRISLKKLHQREIHICLHSPQYIDKYPTLKDKLIDLDNIINHIEYKTKVGQHF